MFLNLIQKFNLDIQLNLTSRVGDEGSHVPLKRGRFQIGTETRHHRSVGKQSNLSVCKTESSRTSLVQIQPLRPFQSYFCRSTVDQAADNGLIVVRLNSEVPNAGTAQWLSSSFVNYHLEGSTPSTGSISPTSSNVEQIIYTDKVSPFKSEVGHQWIVAFRGKQSALNTEMQPQGLSSTLMRSSMWAFSDKNSTSVLHTEKFGVLPKTSTISGCMPLVF